MMWEVMPTSPESKGAAFRALHERDGAFVIPNPWDVGTARILANLGFEALATTSAGHAYSLGLPDGEVAVSDVLAHCRELGDATDLPVSADLEKGFGDSPKSVADTIRAAAEAGQSSPPPMASRRSRPRATRSRRRSGTRTARTSRSTSTSTWCAGSRPPWSCR